MTTQSRQLKSNSPDTTTQPLANFLSIATDRFDRGLGRSLARLDRLRDAKLAGNFLSEADAIESSDTGYATRILLYVIAAIVIFAIGWSVLGHVDKVVSASGRLSTTAPEIAMQAYSASRITAILVTPGDHVAKGQVVARFDPTFAQADLTSAEHKTRSLQSEITRIEAELNGAQTFPETPATDPETIEQGKIFADQMAQYSAQMAVWKSRAAGFDSGLAANQTGIEGLRTQLKMADHVVDIRRTLVAEQAGAPLDLMIAQSSKIDAEMRLKSLVSDTQKLTASRAENEADRTNYANKWQEDLNQRLVAARTELTSATEDLRKARQMEGFAQLQAPVSGTVLEVTPGRSVGSMLKDGETLVTMVPDHSPLFVQAEISPRDIANIRVGQSVRVKLESFPYQTFGTLTGKVKVLGADSVDGKDGLEARSVYQIRIQLDETPAKIARRGIIIRPGLTATADIVTGRRSVASYITSPVLGMVHESMREP